jgi:uncharacterized protein (TIGR03067 family)
MRTLILAAAAAVLAVPAATTSQQPGRTDHLNGRWLCVRVQTRDALEPQSAGWVMTIAGNQVSWKTSNGQSAGPYPVKIDPDARPPHMDFSGVGIYRLDADTLVLCWWSDANSRQATFDMPSQNPPGKTYTFRRVRDEQMAMPRQ